MPWNSNNPVLKDHRLLCYYRLKSLVTSLKAKGRLHILMDVFNDHADRGYFEIVTPEMDRKCVLKHYIPYHIVEKPGSTTPNRVVFDCSASSGPNDPSLNSNLYCGPPKMPDIIGLLIRFRCFAVVVIADVAKAFMQLILNELDRDVFRFLILIDPEKEVTWDNVRECRYTRPLFGAGSSPLLLEQVITYALKRCPHDVASEILKNLFVDNVLLGAASIEEVLMKAKLAKSIFDEMQMNLRDFISNKKSISDAMDTVVPEKQLFLVFHGYLKVIK
uniref:Reverse transcriptase domain-containing protein n=1 Tax=Panagrolaimus superbus TaxID=310955 RepID=A0A914Z6A8_9BILA